MTYRYILNTLMAGLFTILPMLLTLYLIVWLAKAVESFIGGILTVFIPDTWYMPGVGLVTGLIFVFALGLMTKTWLMSRAMDYGEKVFYQIPVVKSIYGSLKDLTEFFSKPEQNDFREVVMVNLNPGDHEIKMMGFVTSNKDGNSLTTGDEEMVMVYLPMSYQIGGYTVTLPRSSVTTINIPMEEAMRYVLTAGLAKSHDIDAL